MLSGAFSVSQANVSSKYGIKCAEMVEMVIMVDVVVMVEMVLMVAMVGCTQNPISTLSHTWVLVRLYGIVFVIIVIIIMIIKSEGVNAQL